MAIRSMVAFSAIPKGMLHRPLCSSTTAAAAMPSFLSQAADEAAEAPGRVQHEPNPSLFVSGLFRKTTSVGLRKAFSAFGEVVYARVATDRNATDHNKGYGFVRYASTEEAQKGIEGMDGQYLDGWVIFAEFARPKPTNAAPQNNMGSGYGSSTSPWHRG